MCPADDVDRPDDEGAGSVADAHADGLSMLRERCRDADIPVKEFRDDYGMEGVVVGMPCGREERPLYLWEDSDIDSLLAAPFEDYIFIAGYRAICSYENRRIEAAIEAFGRRTSRILYRRLFGSVPARDEDTLDDYRIELANEIGGIPWHVAIGPASDDMLGLTGTRSTFFRPLSLSIADVNISRHDQALSLLERVAGSVFFQIDLTMGLPLTLARYRSPVLPGRLKLPREAPPELQFPMVEYDREPMALYWYGRSASGMPLLQFLAYYQAIEFYFPTYSQAEARRRIRNILKDPAFRHDRDADIGRLLAAVSAGSPGLGDERSQLRATLQECLDPGELRSYLTEDDARSKFFSAKAESLTDVVIPLRKPTVDLRDSVTDRIYDIRCRVVHTKGPGHDGRLGLLLPFSPQADLLYHDVRLVQYISRQVIIAGSSPLRA